MVCLLSPFFVHILYLRFDPVAGLVPRTAIPPGATRAREVACIGDEEIVDSRIGVQVLPSTPRRGD
jgi:hypothetical protein